MSADQRSASEGSPRITVDDPEDYNLSRRFQQIHRARDRVKQVRDEAGAMVSRGEMTHGRYREELAQAVADFAIELEWLMRERDEEDGDAEEKDPGDEIWEDVEIEAPEHPDGQIEGIGGFVERYGRIEVRETVEQDSAFSSPYERGSTTALGNPTVETTMRIYRQCNRFMKVIGLEVRMDRGMEVDEI